MSRSAIASIVVAGCLAAATRALAQSPGGAFTCEFLAGGEGRFGNGATIEGDVGANDPGGFLRLGRKTLVAEGVTVTGDVVAIGNGSQVPIVAANVIHAPKANVGSVSGAMLPIHDPFCPIPAVECGERSVSVARGESTGPLAPGSYGDVVLENGATLTLAAGAYRFCSLRTGRNATVEVLGPGQSTIDVAGDLRLENGSKLGPGATASTPVVNVGGSEAKLGAHVVVEAFLSAPAARLRLGRAGMFTGAFCADRVVTGRNVLLTCAEAPPTTTTTSTTSSTTSTTTTTAVPTTSTTSSTTTTTSTTTSSSTTSSSSTTLPTTSTTTTTSPPASTTTTTAPTTTTTTITAPPTTTTLVTTTTTTTTAPPTTTTSTTTTTIPTGVVCGPNGLDVTAALRYPALVGGVSGARLSVNYAPPLAIPGSGNGSTVRQRVTSLLGSGFTVRPNDRDTNADTVDDRLEVDVTSTLNTIPSDDTIRVRYDCPAGTSVTPASLSCETSNTADPSGLPFPPEVAAQITCDLALSVP